MTYSATARLESQADRGAQTAPGPVYYPDLDGLRAVAVLLVILWHLREKSNFVTHIAGWLGVYVFFVISGFLITALLIDEERRTGRISLSAFYIRRGFRILPVYFLVLAVYVMLDFRQPEKWAALKPGLPYYLTFMNEFKPEAASVFGYTWTLGVEEKFYLFWPFLFFLLFAGLRARFVLTAVLYLSLLAVYPWAETTSVSYSGLLVGCMLAIATRYSPRGVQWLSRIPRWSTALLMLAGFALVDRNGHTLPLFHWIAFAVVGNLAVVPGSVLAWAPFVWIGKRSYSMYLIHGLALGPIEDHLPITGTAQQLLAVLVAFALAALGADMLYRFVENPCRNFGKTILVKRRLRSIHAA